MLFRSLAPRFRDPSTPTRASVADAVTKEISVGILDPSNPIELEIALERLAYDRVTINRILAGRRRSAGNSLLDKLIAGGAGADAETTPGLQPGNGENIETSET